jgi:hypothetical protein
MISCRLPLPPVTPTIDVHHNCGDVMHVDDTIEHLRVRNTPKEEV